MHNNNPSLLNRKFMNGLELLEQNRCNERNLKKSVKYSKEMNERKKYQRMGSIEWQRKYLLGEKNRYAMMRILYGTPISPIEK